MLSGVKTQDLTFSGYPRRRHLCVAPFIEALLSENLSSIRTLSMMVDGVTACMLHVIV